MRRANPGRGGREEGACLTMSHAPCPRRERQVYSKAVKKLFSGSPPARRAWVRRGGSRDSGVDDLRSLPPSPASLASLRCWSHLLGHDLKLALCLTSLISRAQRVQVNLSGATILYTRRPVAEILHLIPHSEARARRR